MKYSFILLPLSIAVLASSITHAQTPPDTAAVVPAEVAASPPPLLEAEVIGCNPKIEMSHLNRLAVIDKVIAETKTELSTKPESVKDDAARARIGTFAAGAMDDEILFVSLDRWCWADFHEARKHLAAKDESAAYESALDWKVCLEASFPDRVDLAKPYFSCFPGKTKTKSKSETK